MIPLSKTEIALFTLAIVIEIVGIVGLWMTWPA